jgi:DNA-directed RNA polymerase subunit RPC12/RpoP
MKWECGNCGHKVTEKETVEGGNKEWKCPKCSNINKHEKKKSALSRQI